jgi:hypothetical protein
MSKISLAEAVKLKSVLSKRIHELEEEMDRVAFIDLRLLDKLMYQANIQNNITYNEHKLTIVEAIEYATQLRAKARKYKEFGSSSKEEYPYYGEGVSIIKVATFDPEEYRLRGLEVEKKANRLSNLINAKNYQIELEFDGDKYF